MSWTPFIVYLVAENYQVDGELWDLERPLEKSVKLELLDFENAEGELPRAWVQSVLSSCAVTRQKSFLAFLCPRSRGGCRKALRLSPLSWSPDG